MNHLISTAAANHRQILSSIKAILAPLCILIVFITVNTIFIEDCRCQWVQQSTGTTANLYCIKFINRYTGWACGEGMLLKTTNSGTNWNIVILPVNKPLQRVFPLDSNNVYVVGMFETIIKTTDGGANWLVIRDGVVPQNSYLCCHFINKNTGWISGGGERKILKTTNGGNSFDSIVTTTSGFIEDIYFRDSLSGLYCDNNGAVRKTTNGGYNWFSINIPVGTYFYFFRNFSFINNQIGWISTSSRKVFKTTDFGSNWDSISNIPNGSYGIHNIFFSSANTGWAVGEGYYIFKTTNGGYNWFSQPGNGRHSIFFTNDSVGWEVANLGKIFHTENSGGLLIIKENSISDLSFNLSQNYPNPFNASTVFPFDILKPGEYKLEIFDITGKKVKTLVDGFKTAGYYSVVLNGSDLSSGIYFYRIAAGSFVQTKRMVLIK